jgi:hypothetical protein
MAKQLPLLFLACTLASAQSESNWPAWRGPQNNGSTGQVAFPVKLDPTNATWTASLPGKGCSTPVVWDHHIFLTAPTNGLDAALAFAWDGKPEWTTPWDPNRRERTAMVQAATLHL